MKQLLEERRKRESLEKLVYQEASMRQQLENPLAELEQRFHHTSAATGRGPTIHPMTPTQDKESQRWHEGLPPGLGAPPPLIPEHMRKPGLLLGGQQAADTMRPFYGRALGVNLDQPVTGQIGQGGSIMRPPGQGAATSDSGAQDESLAEGEKIPEGRWKLLKDLPKLELTGAQSWEQGAQYHSWRAQCTTIFSGVGHAFAQYAKLVWSQAEQLYQDKATNMKMPRVPEVRSEHLDFEARFTSALLRILPEAIRTPAVENADDGCISSVMLCVGVLSRLQPAGPEEASSLLSFLRTPPTASTAQDLEGLMRRYTLALRRVEQLQMPPIAPSEQIKALQAMTKTVERKYNTFHMRLNLLRLFPEASSRPTVEGVERLRTTIEQQLHELTADEIAKESRQGANKDIPTVNYAGTGGSQGSTSRGICHFLVSLGVAIARIVRFNTWRVLIRGRAKERVRIKGRVRIRVRLSKLKGTRSNLKTQNRNLSLNLNPNPKLKQSQKQNRSQRLNPGRRHKSCWELTIASPR